MKSRAVPPPDDSIQALRGFARKHLKVFAVQLAITMSGVLAYSLHNGGPLFSETISAVMIAISVVALWAGCSRYVPDPVKSVAHHLRVGYVRGRGTYLTSGSSASLVGG